LSIGYLECFSLSPPFSGKHHLRRGEGDAYRSYYLKNPPAIVTEQEGQRKTTTSCIAGELGESLILNALPLRYPCTNPADNRCSNPIWLDCHPVPLAALGVYLKVTGQSTVIFG